MCRILFEAPLVLGGLNGDRKANAAYVLFMKKYYYLYEEYLASLKK